MEDELEKRENEDRKSHSRSTSKVQVKGKQCLREDGIVETGKRRERGQPCLTGGTGARRDQACGQR